MGVRRVSRRRPMPAEQVGLGLCAAGVAVAAGLVLAVALSGYGLVASGATVLMAAAAARAYAVASGGRLQRGVAPLVLLIVAGTLACLGLLVLVDAWHAFDLFGPELLRMSRVDFLRWALTSRAVLADYAPHAAVAAGGALLGSATAVPLVRATVAEGRPGLVEHGSRAPRVLA